MQPGPAVGPDDLEATRLTAKGGMTATVPALLHELLAASLISSRDWEALPDPVREEVSQCPTPDGFLARLVELGLLHEQHLAFIRAGHTAQVPVAAGCPPASDVVQQSTSASCGLLQELRASGLVLSEDWDALPGSTRGELNQCSDPGTLLAGLVRHGLLTDYQADRIRAGQAFGLVLGNYRVLDRIGAGCMGIVFKGEHRELRQLVAIKVLPVSADQDSQLLERFLTEIRAVAQLQHPNVVAARDAGKVASPDLHAPELRYFVMEYVPGDDLEARVDNDGPLAPAVACGLIAQVASALVEAQKHNLVHRDIKPSNIRVTPEGQAKLLDFGLTRQFGRRLTEPGTLLGTIDYMAPEQVQDASQVDIRADIYGLGGTLFWCLAGRAPFIPQGSVAQNLARRLTQLPPSVRTFRPEVPPELDAVVSRMLALKPEDRYPSPQAVVRALQLFVQPEVRPSVAAPVGRSAAEPGPSPEPDARNRARVHHVLIVDDDPISRTLCRRTLQREGYHCDEAGDGMRALDAVQQRRYDLVVLDMQLPALPGPEVLRLLRENPPCPHFKILIHSGHASPDEMAQMLAAGADDYLSKPFSAVPFLARVQAALGLKDAQDRSDQLNRHLLAVNAELERNLTARDSDLIHARNALVLALARLVEHGTGEKGSHLVRLQRYSRCLAEAATGSAALADQIDPNFIQMLECCAPLHDIGKVGLPDHILLKAGKLDPEETIIMQTHTLIGAETLQEVAQQHRFAHAFLQMAIDITRHHHERYDGTGYPDRLAGDAIPLAARIVAVGDTYDGLRCQRSYRPALAHGATVKVMTEIAAGQFDPRLRQLFQRVAVDFERVFRELPD